MPTGLRPLSPPVVFGQPGASPLPFPAYAPPLIYLSAAPTAGALQVETATAAGTASATGTAQVTVTSTLLPGGTKTIPVAITNADSATAIGGKIRAALAADNDIIEHFTVGGATTAVVLTVRQEAANDTGLNIAIATGTATGVTAAPTSTNTTTGVAGTGGIVGQEAKVGTTFYKLVSDNPHTWRTITLA